MRYVSQEVHSRSVGSQVRSEILGQTRLEMALAGKLDNVAQSHLLGFNRVTVNRQDAAPGRGLPSSGGPTRPVLITR